ncbi:polyamine-modulated factor 1 [Spea bombifrons]|uniref:polyamine-modulated factor 1 n=1 Tax=Spea bombifrons TaxID=233779 RepID=UPI00234A783B|nr:polyamine-modulated factor 1 [Spea bombifrons]
MEAGEGDDAIAPAGPFEQTAGAPQEPKPPPLQGPQRLLIFNTLMDKFLEGLVEAGSYQRFARCYRRFYKVQPEITRSIYDQFVSQLQESIKDEIQEIKNEGNLEELLDSLDRMEMEAGDVSALAWRPSGIPEEDLRSHLVPYLLQQREYLRKGLKERTEENAKLAQSVLAGRKKIQDMQQEIEKRKLAWLELSKAQRELVLSIETPK